MEPESPPTGDAYSCQPMPDDERSRLDDYCVAHADEFGGRFGGPNELLGVAFTDHVEAHKAALERLVHPTRLTVVEADRTWQDVFDANERTQQRLMRNPGKHPAVFGVGIGRTDGQFVICVIVDQDHPEATAEIINLAAPEQIDIRYGPMAEEV
jgi:hypothetical protein